MKGVAHASAALLLALSLSRLATAQDAKTPLTLSIETPSDGSTVGGSDGLLLVAGRAVAGPELLDVIFLLDTSDSTQEPSGADINGNGVIGGRRGPKSPFFAVPASDEGDSVLAAEIAGCRLLLSQLDSRTTRVGVVAFAGDNDAETPDSYTQVPLTDDFAKVEYGLDVIYRKGPGGMTNMVSAINLATIELIGTPSARSKGREGAKRVIVLIGDGQPSLPLEGNPLQNATMATQQGGPRRKARHPDRHLRHR